MHRRQAKRLRTLVILLMGAAISVCPITAVNAMTSISTGTSVTSTVYGPHPPVLRPPILTAPTRHTSRNVYTFAETYQGQTSQMTDISVHRGLISTVAAFEASVLPDGTLSGGVPEDLQRAAERSSLKVQLTVANLGPTQFNRALIDNILKHSGKQKALIRNILRASASPYVSGINLDFEEIPGVDEALFNTFLKELYRSLHAAHRELVVDVPAETSTQSGRSYDAAYNYKQIGSASDAMVVMAYDYSYPGGPAGPIAPTWWVARVAHYATSQVKPQHVLLGIPTYAYDWYRGTTRAHSLPTTMKLAVTHHAKPKWDVKDASPFYTFTDAAGWHQVYYENMTSLREKLVIAKQDGLGGIAFWRAGLELPSFWTLIAQYEKGKS